MPFDRSYRRPDYDFKKWGPPSGIAVMKAAYESSLTELDVTEQNGPITELIARAILNVTLRGERDLKEIKERALNALGVRFSFDGHTREGDGQVRIVEGWDEFSKAAQNLRAKKARLWVTDTNAHSKEHYTGH